MSGQNTSLLSPARRKGVSMEQAELLTHLHRLSACPPALEWVRGLDLAESWGWWKLCERPGWMLWLAVAVGTDARTMEALAGDFDAYAQERRDVGDVEGARVAAVAAYVTRKALDDPTTYSAAEAARLADKKRKLTDAHVNAAIECAAIVATRIPWAMIEAKLVEDEREREALAKATIQAGGIREWRKRVRGKRRTRRAA
jgi:hypothetical protein